VRSSACAECLLGLAVAPGESPPLPAQAVGALLSGGGLKARLLGILDDRRRRALPRTLALALAFFGAMPFLPLASAIPTTATGVAIGPIRLGEGPVVGCAIDATTRRPVPGAEVDFYLRGEEPRDAIRVGTDAVGCFRLPKTPFLAHRMAIYVRKGRLAARTPTLSAPSAFDLARTIELRPAPTLSGVVRAESGAPLAGATVRFARAEDWAAGPGEETAAVTDARGRFHIDGVLHGNYRLVAEAPWGTATVFLARVQNGGVSGLDVTVPREWPVSGRLFDENDRPVAGARLTRLRRNVGDQRHVDWDETGADGSFSLLPLGHRIEARADRADGTLLATFSDRGETHVFFDRMGSPGRLVWLNPARAPERIVARRAGYLEGKAVFADGRPAAGARILTSTRAQPVTDAEGRFRVGPLEIGSVRIAAVMPSKDGRPGMADFIGFAEATLHPGEWQRGVEVVLRPRAAPRLRVGARRPMSTTR
jgi:hypothetical protein